MTDVQIDDEEFTPPYTPKTKFWDSDYNRSEYIRCSTEYCRGADAFDEEWNNDSESWVAGWACPCGCADDVWEYNPDTEKWERF